MASHSRLMLELPGKAALSLSPVLFLPVLQEPFHFRETPFQRRVPKTIEGKLLIELSSRLQ